MLFNRDPMRALRHYHAGVLTGALSLGPNLDGLPPRVRRPGRSGIESPRAPRTAMGQGVRAAARPNVRRGSRRPRIR